MNMIKRVSMAGLLAVAGFAVSAAAVAQPNDAKPQCEGKGNHDGKGKGERGAGMFKKADKNADGFLTQDEVGAQRWERLKAADANKDNKVSLEEMKQAKKDGKLRRGHTKPGTRA